MIQTKAGKAVWSLLMAVMLTFQAVPPVVVAEAAEKPSPYIIIDEGTVPDTGYYGNGSDEALYISAGQTVTLPVAIPHQSIVQMNYKSITIEYGGTLRCAAPNAGLILRVQGDVNIYGIIDQSGMAPVTNPNNRYTYPPEVNCGAGGNGGDNLYNEERPELKPLGGIGMPSRKYGGGYGGGGAGGSAETTKYASVNYKGGNGGNADNITVLTSQPLFEGGASISTITNPGAAMGLPGFAGGGGSGGNGGSQYKVAANSGAGGNAPGANGSESTSTNYKSPSMSGGGGGAGNIGGGVVMLYAGGAVTVSGSGLIDCSGGNGGNGGRGANWSTTGNSDYFYGCGGAGGGGGGGGSVYIRYGQSFSGDSRLDVSAGTGGTGAKKIYAHENWWHDNHGAPAPNGEVGTVGTVSVARAPDTVPPVISGVTMSAAWDTSNAVTISATDNMSGVKEYAYSTANTAPSTGWQSGNSFTLTANGNYYAFAKDGMGNMTAGYAFTVSKVDTAVPTITNVAVTPAGWTNSGTKAIAVTATDNQSGISGYAITTSTTAPASGWQTANTFNKPEGTYYVWANDHVGRVSAYKQVTVSQIDTAKPTVSAVTVPTAWGQDNTVTVTAADVGSGLKEYAVTNSGTAPSTGWQSSSSFTLLANGTYHSWARDNVGNVSLSRSFTVSKVDTAVPTITNVAVTPAGWTESGTKTITVTASDGQSGIAGYAITTSTTAPASGWQTANTFTKPEGTYYVWAKDNVGRVSAYKQVTVSQIDTAKPTVSAVTVPTAWGQDNTVTVTAADVGSGIKEYAVTNNSTAPSTGWQSGDSFTLAVNGTYYAWAKDRVGNISDSYSFVVDMVDTDIPVISAADVTPEGWTGSGTKTIAVTATDSQSGVEGYAITTSTTAPASGWQTANAFNKPEGTYYVWAKDNVGRISAYKQVTVSQIDTAKPTVSAVTVPNMWGQDNTVTVTAADVGSGIKEYAVTNNSTAPSTGWQSGDSFTLAVNGTCYAWAKDKVGNISDSYSFVVDMVDTDIPVISAADVTPEGWTGSGTKTITVTATDSQSDVLEYAITGDMSIPADGWQTANTFDKGAGAYYLWAKDIAGNISVPFGVAVGKVDNIKPIVSGVTVPDLWGTSANIGIGASDLGSGLQAYAVTKGGKPVDDWQSSDVITVTSNGDYSAWVKDNADNVSLPVAFTVDRVDKLKPLIESVTVREKRTLVQQRGSDKVPGVTSVEDMPDKWVKTVELILSSIDSTATDEDGCSGVVAYAVSTSSTEPGEGWQASSSFTCEQNGTYYLWSKDGAGNVSEPKKYHLNKIDDVPPEFDADGGESDGSGSVGIPNRWVPVATVEVKGADNTGTQDFAVTKTPEPPSVWQDDHYFDIEANGTYYAWIRDKSNNITGPDMFVVDKVDNLPPGVSGITFEGGMVKMDARDAPASTDSGSSGIIGYAISKAATAPPETRSAEPKVTDFDWYPDNDITLKEGGLYEARTIDRAGNISPPCLFEYVPPDTSTGEDDAWDKVVDDILSDDSSEERVYSITMDGHVRIPRSLLVRLRGKAVILRIEHGERYIWAIDCRTIGDIPPWRLYYDLTIEEGGEDSRYLYQLPYSTPIVKRFDVVHRDKEDLPFKAELSIRLHYSFAERYVVYLFKNAGLIGGELSADRLPPYLKRKSE